MKWVKFECLNAFICSRIICHQTCIIFFLVVVIARVFVRARVYTQLFRHSSIPFRFSAPGNVCD